MKNLNVFFILTFLFFAQIGTSQINPELITKIRGKYYYQGQVYDRVGQLKEVFKTNPKAYQSHRTFTGARRAHRVLTLVSAAALVRWSRWIDERPPGCSGCHPDIEAGLVSVLVLAGSTVAIIGSAIPMSKHRNKAKDIFNEGVLSSSKVGSIPPSLNIQTTQNGIGLVFNF